MKLRTFNKKVIRNKVLNKKSNKTSNKKSHSHNIPLNFFKPSTKNTISLDDTLNSLPSPIKYILQNGNNPISIKSSGSIINIKTDTGLNITIKTETINDKIPECKIYDKPNRTELLNTFKR